MPIGLKLDNCPSAVSLLNKNIQDYMKHPIEIGVECYDKNNRYIDLYSDFLNLVKEIQHPNLIVHLSLKNKILNIQDKDKGLWLKEWVEEFGIAKKLNAKYCILHATSKECKTFSEEQCIENIIENAEMLSKNTNIPFCIENTYENINFYEKLFKSLSNSIGFCLDIGHAKIHNTTNNEHIMSVLKIFKKENRTLHFHLHDNDGKNDSHYHISDVLDEKQIAFIYELNETFKDSNMILETRNDSLEKDLIEIFKINNKTFI